MAKSDTNTQQTEKSMLNEKCESEACLYNASEDRDGCPSFRRLQHIRFLLNAGADDSSLEAFMTEQIRMGGAYWATTALWCLGLTGCECDKVLEQIDSNNIAPDRTCRSCKRFGSAISIEMKERESAVLQYIEKCKCSNGAYSYSPDHEANIASTHYALLLLCGLGKLQSVDSKKLSLWIKHLETDNCSGFKTDEWGEIDSRFVYCTVASLCLIGELDRGTANRAIKWIQRLRNYDGGYAWVPGGESHAASAFCCIAALALCEGLWSVDKTSLALWLLDRQTCGGGFNGRPEKAPDICYSYWIYATMHIIGYSDYVDSDSLTKFILQAQDSVTGGIADRPDDMGDVFHTFFGIAALGMMKTLPNVEFVHPVFSIPSSIVKKLSLPWCIFW